MDIKRIDELKKVQLKQDTLEAMIHDIKNSSKQIKLRVEFENDELEFYPADRDGYEIEPNKFGLLIYLEHEVKHCEMVKCGIVKEMALEILPKFDTPERAYIETAIEYDNMKVINKVEPDKLLELKQLMESGENRLTIAK